MTNRPSVPALESILCESTPVLDHGFVRVIDYMGDDNAIVQAARVSYGRGTKRTNLDAGLIRYLMRHHHTTPFEMCEIKLHIKLPIFVARQWIRHRTASVNEYSARYSILSSEFYVPEAAHIALQSHSNKQGRGAVLSPEKAHAVQEILREDALRCYDNYARLLSEPNPEEEREQEFGIARELARMNLTLNYYTEWYWKTDLHNLLHFLRLRADSHAQYEIRAYAEVMLDIVRNWVPITYQAFVDYRLGAVTLSAQALEVVRQRLAGKDVSRENTGLSQREWEELGRVFAFNAT